MKMKTINISLEARKAIFLGAVCSIAYFAVYTARNILSAVTPQMLVDGFVEEYIGIISSAFLVAYAVGQLVNGFIGDRIKAKWMISIGLLGAGIANSVFSTIVKNLTVAVIAYSTVGFLLSMIYAPMVKLVSENTEYIYAVRCSVGYSFASLLGSPMAGLLASFFVWQSAFAVGSGMLFVMALTCFTVFSVFESKGLINSRFDNNKKQQLQSVKILFKRKIIKYSFVSILTGIVRTSVVFWLPTYINQQLGFSEKNSTIIYTVSTLFISTMSFIAIFIYERLGRKMDFSVLWMFTVSAIFFLLTFCVNVSILNLIFIVVAIMAASGASSILWSVYCPSLGDTGRVSTATGFLDFLSYMAAAAANLIFANAVKDIGWSKLVLIWTALMVMGVIISLPFEKLKKKSSSCKSS